MLVRRARAGIEVLDAQPLVDGRLVAVGYCFGFHGGAMHGFTHVDASPNPGVAYDAVADARSQAAIRLLLAELFGEALVPATRTP